MPIFLWQSRGYYGQVPICIWLVGGRTSSQGTSRCWVHKTFKCPLLTGPQAIRVPRLARHAHLLTPKHFSFHVRYVDNVNPQRLSRTRVKIHTRHGQNQLLYWTNRFSKAAATENWRNWRSYNCWGENEGNCQIIGLDAWCGWRRKGKGCYSGSCPKTCWHVTKG